MLQSMGYGCALVSHRLPPAHLSLVLATDGRYLGDALADVRAVVGLSTPVDLASRGARVSPGKDHMGVARGMTEVADPVLKRVWEFLLFLGI